MQKGFLFFLIYPQSNAQKQPGAWLIYLCTKQEVKLVGSGSMMDVADLINEKRCSMNVEGKPCSRSQTKTG
jgi:hypothetical protein